ncbi:MAG: MarR family transcriptional regulator [Alphaproteobacteria bacterium]|nr:MarR family transcriptional regulator [Alphaproteobacteria bacterium]
MSTADGARKGAGQGVAQADTRRPAPAGADVEVEFEIGWLMHDVHRLLSRAFDDKFRKLGLTRAQWRVMVHLLREDGLTQKALAEVDQIEKAPMGRLVDRLEQLGWIERRPDPLDGRARRVYRTAKIDPLLPELKAGAATIFDHMFDGLDDADRGRLHRTLSAMRDRLTGLCEGYGVFAELDGPPAGGLRKPAEPLLRAD